MAIALAPVPIRILIAEDRPDHRALLAEALRDPRYLIVLAHDGRELLDILVGTPSGYFGVVVTDVFMPGMRGTEVLARASSRSRFILVTASGDASIDRSAVELGAVAVVRKPFDPHELLELVDSVIGVAPPRAPQSDPRA